jgi:hypothetical protein
VNYQTKAFQISFLLHILIFATALTLSLLIVPAKKIMVLDFNLRKPEARIKEVIPPPPPMPVIKTQTLKPKPEIVKEKEPTKPIEEKARLAPAPETPPVVKLPEAQSLDSRPMEYRIIQRR